MRDLLSALLGVPATILVAAGIGLALVTVGSRLRARRDPPLRWRHLALGVAVLGLGLALMAIDVAILPLRA